MDYLPQGVTGVMLPIYIQDLSSTTAGGLTGLSPSTVGLSGYYFRDTSSGPIVFPLVSGTVGTFVASGLVAINDNIAPGDYQLCPPNAAFASGARFVTVNLFGANNMLPVKMKFYLGDAPLTYLAPGAIQRNSYGTVAELSAVPSFPANPQDLWAWNAMRATNQTITTSNPTGSGGQDIVYNSSTTPIGSSVFTDNGTNFTRAKYQ